VREVEAEREQLAVVHTANKLKLRVADLPKQSQLTLLIKTGTGIELRIAHFPSLSLFYFLTENVAFK
jgi:hypothetical protein